jgi:hypothetical protein
MMYQEQAESNRNELKDEIKALNCVHNRTGASKKERERDRDR